MSSFRLGSNAYLHTGSVSGFKAVFLSSFSLSFFGIGLMRLWYQFNFYNLHFSADYGHVTVGANIVRVAMIALLVLVSARFGFSQRSRSFFVWSGLLLMTLSSLLYFLDLFFGTTAFEVARFIVGGIGLVGGEIIWVFFLERLKPGQAFLCVAGGLALSCALSLVAGYLSPEFIGILNLFVPTLAVFAYWRAMDVLDSRGTCVQDGTAATCTTLYDEGLRGGLIQVVGAFVLYGFLLGVALGFPDGRLRELSQEVRSMHQVLVILVVGLVVWWVLVRGRGFRLSTFWYFENALMVASISLLISGWQGAGEASTFLLTNAVTCFYLPLVFFVYLIGRNSRMSMTLVYAIVYGGTLLAMSLGRVTVYAIGPHLGQGLWLLIGMSFIAIVEMVLILRPRVMGDHPIGYELAALPRTSLPADDFDGRRQDEVASFAVEFSLSSTEADIVRLLAQGRSRNVIAGVLNYSENTVRNYTRSIYRKVRVHSKQELLDRLRDYREA